MVLGLWLEKPASGKDEACAGALARALKRFQAFLGAGQLDVRAIREPLLRRRAEAG